MCGDLNLALQVLNVDQGPNFTLRMCTAVLQLSSHEQENKNLERLLIRVYGRIYPSTRNSRILIASFVKGKFFTW